MAKATKRFSAVSEKVDVDTFYTLTDAFALAKETASAKFDESVDVAINLGIDAKKSDQAVRGATVLPKGTGKTVRVAVFTDGDNVEKAKEAGADIVGMDDLATQVKAGEMDFDIVIASPDAMRIVGQLGQILGPRGLMPNPKTGTVSADVATAVRNALIRLALYIALSVRLLFLQKICMKISWLFLAHCIKQSLRQRKVNILSV